MLKLLSMRLRRKESRKDVRTLTYFGALQRREQQPATSTVTSASFWPVGDKRGKLLLPGCIWRQQWTAWQRVADVCDAREHTAASSECRIDNPTYSPNCFDVVADLMPFFPLCAAGCCSSKCSRCSDGRRHPQHPVPHQRCSGVAVLRRQARSIGGATARPTMRLHVGATLLHFGQAEVEAYAQLKVSHKRPIELPAAEEKWKRPESSTRYAELLQNVLWSRYLGLSARKVRHAARKC